MEGEYCSCRMKNKSECFLSLHVYALSVPTERKGKSHILHECHRSSLHKVVLFSMIAVIDAIILSKNKVVASVKICLE